MKGGDQPVERGESAAGARSLHLVFAPRAENMGLPSGTPVSDVYSVPVAGRELTVLFSRGANTTNLPRGSQHTARVANVTL